MAKKVTDVVVHAHEAELEDLDVSVDQIDDGLFLGNLACARDHKTLERLGITHVLTIDLVPLPRTILDRPGLYFKFLQLADVTKEDLISHLPETNAFIKQAIAKGGTVLVHCYFGVSRSAAVVVGYIMEKYQLNYDDALALVRSKRHYVHPNMGFEAQLKLFGHMGYRLNRDDPRFKQFRLKMAGQKLKQVMTYGSETWSLTMDFMKAKLPICIGRFTKDDHCAESIFKILPQLFADLVKPDPGLTRERPDPVVYRCKKCRRVLASQSNIIPHIPKQVKIELAKKGIRPPPSKLTGLHCAENGQILMEKLKNLASQFLDSESSSGQSGSAGESQIEEGCSQEAEKDTYSSEQNLVDGNVAARADLPSVCRAMWFVEPVAWMQRVALDPSGKLLCPKCHAKVGSFSWVMGCKCPCGQKVAPAFYLVPSKVEWANIVQNVQITV